MLAAYLLQLKYHHSTQRELIVPVNAVSISTARLLRELFTYVVRNSNVSLNYDQNLTTGKPIISEGAFNRKKGEACGIFCYNVLYTRDKWFIECTVLPAVLRCRNSIHLLHVSPELAP